VLNGPGCAPGCSTYWALRDVLTHYLDMRRGGCDSLSVGFELSGESLSY